MNIVIKIPDKIKVGFQERTGTYTGKLAYVIYYDETGKLRKETSWNSWRDDKIEPQELANEPTSGFVLNKKVGDYQDGWNSRKAHIRVYDPRGFEFEIGVENLLYILENTNSIKGKGLEGDFVYGWDNKELVLLPTNAFDYKEITDFNNLIKQKNYIKPKEFVEGITYKTNKNEDLLYLGKYDYYDWRGNLEGLRFYFLNSNNHIYSYKTVNKKFIEIVSSEYSDKFAKAYEKMQGETYFSPIDREEEVECSIEELSEICKEQFRVCLYTPYYLWKLYTRRGGEYTLSLEKQFIDGKEHYLQSAERERVMKNHGIISCDEYEVPVTLEEVIEKIKPKIVTKYLKNGRLYSKGNSKRRENDW